MPLLIFALVAFVVWASKNVAQDVVAWARGEQSPREKYRAERVAAREARTGQPGRRAASSGRPLRDYWSDLWADSWEDANTRRADRAADRRAVYENARDAGMTAHEAARAAGYGIVAKLRGLLDYVSADPAAEEEDPEPGDAQAEPERGGARTACPNCGNTLTRAEAGWMHPNGTNICPSTGSPYPIPEQRQPLPPPADDQGDADPATVDPAPDVDPELLAAARALREEAGYLNTALLQRSLQVPYETAVRILAALADEDTPQPAAPTEGTTDMSEELNYEGTLAAHAVLLEENKRISDALAVIDDAVRTMSIAAETIGAAAVKFNLPPSCLTGANAVTDGFNADEVHRLMDLTDGAQAGITASQDYLITEFGDAAETMARNSTDGSFVNA